MPGYAQRDCAKLGLPKLVFDLRIREKVSSRDTDRFVRELVNRVGVEPTANGLRGRRSTTELPIRNPTCREGQAPAAQHTPRNPESRAGA